MAASTRTSVGVGVTIALLGLAALGFFVTTVVFFAQKRAAETNLANFQTENEEFILTGERQQDDIRAIKAAAQSKRQSVVGYLSGSLQDTMQQVTGSRNDTPEDLARRVERLGGGGSLMSIMRDKDAQITSLAAELRTANEARDRALQDLENEVGRVNTVRDEFAAKVDELKASVDSYAAEANAYREQLENARGEMDARVARIEREARDRESGLNAAKERTERELLLAQDTISRLQSELRGQQVQPTDEFALVDGKVISVDAAANAVYLDVGASNKVPLGMTFEVYSEPSAIRPDAATGNYPAGKASLEVIRVDGTTATARIVSQKRGNPVVKGDVIANAIYDPSKSYKFLVYGNFDTNGDGIATPQEQEDIRNMVGGWGGQVVDELAGDIDFLVLGERPTLPPRPTDPRTPPAVIAEFLRLQQIVDRYNELQRQAIATSIPILNQHRLYTLTGQR